MLPACLAPGKLASLIAAASSTRDDQEAAPSLPPAAAPHPNPDGLVRRRSPPATAVAAQKALINACEAEAVPHLLASNYAADYPQFQDGEFTVNDRMKEVCAYLEGKEVTRAVHMLVGCLVETFWSFSEWVRWRRGRV
ncbi:hypothetical protein B0J12DRAFT_696294 [Macrophomina phaseolina]|uniref:Uncharacterized protein n=1 Tax=Macrophomina phaseolina TaxID=35725 RepID=A0ABQ8GJL4_9PEZI|nr:hypothetical protein B0J12DRAFT_696294 [Macrophomina phaseolina]